MPEVKALVSEQFTVIRGFRGGRDLDRLDVEWLGESLKKTNGGSKNFGRGAVVALGVNPLILASGKAMGIAMVVANVTIPVNAEDGAGSIDFHFTTPERDTVYTLDLEHGDSWREVVHKVLNKNFDKAERCIGTRAVRKTS